MKTNHISKNERFAAHLEKARETGEGVQPITELDPDLTIDEAYSIQLHTIEQYIQAGDQITGKKIGLTSKVVQEALGVDEPDYGHLLSSMVVDNRGTVPFEKVLQPKVEGELAFILKEDLEGPNVTTIDVLQATDVVVPAIEIVDSRIKDWKITLADTVSDNASSGLYVLGDQAKKVTELDLKHIGMAMYKNDALQNTGAGAAALGNPAKCVAWLANKLARYNIRLKAGEVILSGALSAMVDARPGDHFRVKFQELGEVEVTFSK